MSTLYLVRHGQASSAPITTINSPLTGREQVEGYSATISLERGETHRSHLLRHTRSASAKPRIYSRRLCGVGADARSKTAFNESTATTILRGSPDLSAPERARAGTGWPGLKKRPAALSVLPRASRPKAWVDAQIAAEKPPAMGRLHGRIVAALGNIVRAEGRSKTLDSSAPPAESSARSLRTSLALAQPHGGGAQLGRAQRFDHPPHLQCRQGHFVDVQRPAAPRSRWQARAHYLPVAGAKPLPSDRFPASPGSTDSVQTWQALASPHFSQGVLARR